MIYAYIRVSTDKQTVENQRFEINRFAKQRDFQIDVWVEETVSGTRSAKDRKLGVLLKRIKKGDTLIVSEISRLGRRLMEVMSILNACILITSINRFAKQRDFQIDVWVEETVSGTRSAKDRKLGVLLKRIKKGDTLIVSEISRLGRRLMEVMSILNACMLKNVILLTVKEKYELGNNIQSQILAFAFSLSAQIERDLISQRTREGLARRIASGQKLGRPMGGHNSKYKLTGKEEKIKAMLEAGTSKAEMARKLKVSRNTLAAFLNRNRTGIPSN